jgi:hypothetical protein
MLALSFGEIFVFPNPARDELALGITVDAGGCDRFAGAQLANKMNNTEKTVYKAKTFLPVNTASPFC